MAFKQDDDFLRYLTMGAAGTTVVKADLRSRGHRVHELERYSTANKLWATKIKRLRIPDLFCLSCDLRVEAKAKSKLEIKLSESSLSGRQWDAGLRDGDLVAFAACVVSDGVPRVSAPQYFSVRDLRASVGLSKVGPPKAASAGAERDRVWPAIVPARAGTITEIGPTTVALALDSGSRKSYASRWVHWYAYPSVGAHVAAGVQFLAGPVPIMATTECPGPTWHPLTDLYAADDIDRYAAVKACGLLELDVARERLEWLARDDADQRIRLEAVGALARLSGARWTRELVAWGREVDLPQGLALEAVFLLSEIASEDSADALADLARDHDLPDESRAAAVWGLGRAGLGRPEAVLDFISDESDTVALHAIAALAGELSPTALGRLSASLHAHDREAAAASEVLARLGDPGIRVLLDAVGAGGSARSRALVALGRLSRTHVLAVASGALGDEAEEILGPLWLDRETNWARAGENPYALGLLDRQTLHAD